MMNVRVKSFRLKYTAPYSPATSGRPCCTPAVLCATCPRDMHLRLRKRLLEQLLIARGGRRTVLCEAQLDRTTLWRWMQKGLLPNDPTQLLRLAHALDLDPVLLFDLEKDLFPQLCGRIISLVRQRSWSSFLPSISFVENLVLPSAKWPPAQLSPDYPCQWHTSTFVHRPEEGAHYYAALVISPCSLALPRAQAWHFAYRNLPGERPFIPWGLVCAVEDRLELYNYDGTIKYSILSNERFVVETWFGGGAAEFCVASLHPFSLTVERQVPEGLPSLRFD